MSRSFVDKVRAEPPSDRRRISVVGIDPDVHELGLAWVLAVVGGGLPLQVEDVRLLPFVNKPPKRSTRHQVIESMCTAFTGAEFHKVCPRLTNLAVIESQEFYPNRDDSRPKMVSVANSLIAVATMTGRAASLALERSIPIRIVAPKMWKANRSKEADHKLSAEIIGSAQVTLVTQAGDTSNSACLTALSSKYEHALDALGIALYGVEQLHRGTWK